MSHKLVTTRSLPYALLCKFDTELLAMLESGSRELITQLSPEKVVRIYSSARREFIRKLTKEVPKTSYCPPKNLEKKLWGISFRSPLCNAAGMFKDGFGYPLAAQQGAGAFLAGTATAIPRLGFPYDNNSDNRTEGILHPFIPLPRSEAAINKLGLPNPGDGLMQKRLQEIEKISGCPVGISVALSPNLLYAHGEKPALHLLVKNMHQYVASGVDFIELNESCPNTGEKFSSSSLVERLLYIQKKFLQERKRFVPVVVKFSCDTAHQQISGLLDMLFHLGYDGINLGNTSTNYTETREKIHSKEHKHFDYFTSTFGGGVSGKPLNEKSLALAREAVRYFRQGPPTQEFHVIRTGGISSVEDLVASEAAGISLNQWFTGYFEGFAKEGHDVYRRLLRKYMHFPINPLGCGTVNEYYR